jgi:hypothetical protein
MPFLLVSIGGGSLDAACISAAERAAEEGDRLLDRAVDATAPLTPERSLPFSTNQSSGIIRHAGRRNQRTSAHSGVVVRSRVIALVE